MGLALIISYSLLGALAILALALAYKYWGKSYLIFDPRLLFPFGLLITRSLTNSAVISVLMWYFTYYRGDLVISAVLSNIQQALSSFCVVLLAHLSVSFVGSFRTILFSTTAYVFGLLVLWMYTPYDVKWLIGVALVLLSLGTSADNLLEKLVYSLVNETEKSRDHTKDIGNKKGGIANRSRMGATIWSRGAYVVGAISATLWVAPNATGLRNDPTWRSAFFICIVGIASSLLIFCLGHAKYPQGELMDRPIGMFYRVFRDHVIKPNSGNSTNSSRQNGSTQNTKQDTLSGMTPERSDTTTQEDGGSKPEDMVVVRNLLRLFPMWGLYLVISLISATGSTFFLEQYNGLNTSDKIPIQIYGLLQSLSGFAIPLLYGLTPLSKKTVRVKIGVGMLCSIISCVFAWQLEVRRLKTVADDEKNTPISFLWLAPQFFVLGCMEGLTGEGLLSFFKSQIKNKTIRSYGKEYIELMMSLGKLINIFLILIFKKHGDWFEYSIDTSRVDKYYRLLVWVCSANFIIYCCVAKFYYKGAEQNQGSTNDDDDDSAEP